MTKPYKLLFFTIIISVVAIAIVVYRYEHLLSRQQKHEPNAESALQLSNKQYTAAETIELIKKSKEYLGDSITIFDNGDILSSNQKFQGTIKAVMESKDNMDIVRNNAKANGRSVKYNIYILAATYYRQQYASEFEKQ